MGAELKIVREPEKAEGLTIGGGQSKDHLKYLATLWDELRQLKGLLSAKERGLLMEAAQKETLLAYALQDLFNQETISRVPEKLRSSFVEAAIKALPYVDFRILLSAKNELAQGPPGSNAVRSRIEFFNELTKAGSRIEKRTENQGVVVSLAPFGLMVLAAVDNFTGSEVFQRKSEKEREKISRELARIREYTSEKDTDKALRSIASIREKAFQDDGAGKSSKDLVDLFRGLIGWIKGKPSQEPQKPPIDYAPLIPKAVAQILGYLGDKDRVDFVVPQRNRPGVDIDMMISRVKVDGIRDTVVFAYETRGGKQRDAAFIILDPKELKVLGGLKGETLDKIAEAKNPRLLGRAEAEMRLLVMLVMFIDPQARK